MTKKYTSAAVAGMLLLAAQANAATQFNITAADLADEIGALLPQNSLVLFVVDTSDNGFTATIDPGTSLAAGQTIDTDDLIIARFDLANSGLDGALVDQVNVTYGGNVTAGDNVGIYWFTGHTLSSTTALPGEFFGFHTDAVGLDGSVAWELPADTGATFELIFKTISQSGTWANVEGFADTQIIPEPSTGLLVGMAMVGALKLRRKQS